jgi:YD repeat-containing protein
MVVDGNGAEREAEICSYDLTGRKTKVEFISEPRHPAACGTMYGVEGAQQGYGAKGVVSITTLFDDREQPCDVLFQDKDREIILRVILTRDSAGRLVREESRSGDRQPLPIAQIFENAPADERVAAEAVLAQLFNPQKAIWSTTYRYDDRSCQIERCTWIGGLKQSRTTWEYDEHDNVIREIKQETVGGGLQTDESGKLQFINEKLSNHGVRYEYKYDSHGNWTGRVVSMRYETNLDLQRSNTERREINYYPST